PIAFLKSSRGNARLSCPDAPLGSEAFVYCNLMTWGSPLLRANSPEISIFSPVRRLYTGRGSNSGDEQMAARQLGAVLRHIRRLAVMPATPNTTDSQLLERFVLRKEEEAFAALLRRHERLVWGVCRRVLRNRADAEDAFQATFWVLARKANSIRRRASIGG